MSNEATQNMQSALDYEKSCWSRADLFYTNRYPRQTIYRPDWESGKEYQKADIDVCIRSKTGQGWPMELKISEKFRTQPWPDVCIEIYEDLDALRPGWGKESAADWHFFFHEHKWKQIHTSTDGCGKRIVMEEDHDQSFVRMVPTWAIRKMWAICRDLYTETFKDMRSGSVGQREVILKHESITLLIVPTKVNGKIAYRGACACIPIELFSTILNCEIEEQTY